jgi:hypothetical protein
MYAFQEKLIIFAVLTIKKQSIMESSIFQHFAAKGLLYDLSDYQVETFRYACKKAVVENPTLNFNDLCIAARIYLNLIRQFPLLDLGQLNHPDE